METLTTTQSAGEATSSDILARLLDAELAYDTDAHNGFTSHLAMGLVAAARLGADAGTLERWFQNETADGYLIARSERPEWLTEGIDRVQRNEIDAEVRSTLGDLVDRTGGFFHWMIRLELAIDAGHVGQVANALGDWQRRPRRAPAALPAPTGSSSVADVLTEVWTTTRFRQEGVQGSSDHSKARRHLVTEVADSPDVLDQMAAFVADLHWAVDNFSTLHLVTGTRAARALFRYLGEAGGRRLAHAHLHAVASVLPSLPVADLASANSSPLVSQSAGLPGWDGIGRDAIDSGDAHTVKLVYASRLEEATTANTLYRAIAARAAGTPFVDP